MIELKNQEQLRLAIERATAECKNLLVQLTDVARKYRVTNRQKGETYEVTFQVAEDGRRFGHFKGKRLRYAPTSLKPYLSATNYQQKPTDAPIIILIGTSC